MRIGNIIALFDTHWSKNNIHEIIIKKCFKTESCNAVKRHCLGKLHQIQRKRLSMPKKRKAFKAKIRDHKIIRKKRDHIVKANEEKRPDNV